MFFFLLSQVKNEKLIPQLNPPNRQIAEARTEHVKKIIDDWVVQDVVAPGPSNYISPLP